MHTSQQSEPSDRADLARIRQYYRTFQSPPSPQAMRNELRRIVRATLEEAGLFPLAGKRIYDMGCGSGGWLACLVEWGATPDGLTGIDIAPARIHHAETILPPGVSLAVGDASRSQLPDASQDLVMQFVVFATIQDRALTARLAQEARRVLKPGGVMLWYDLRVPNPWNRSIRGVRAREIRALFPGADVRLRSTMLVAPVARWLAPRAPRLYRALARVPLLHTHLIGTIRMPGGG